MKHFKRLNVWFSSQRHLYWFFVAVLMAVNVFLFFTEDISPLTRVPFLLLPLAFYMALMTLCRRPGTSAWILFPMFFLGAFQMVLLYLFCGFCAAAGQQGNRHHQCRKQGNKAVQCSFVH